MTTILKLGGSVITDKDRPETVDHETLEMLGATIAEHDVSDLLIVHGGGSFGHHHAAAHGVSQTVGTTDPAAVRDITDAMKRLNTAVVDVLVDHGVPGVPVHPFSGARRTESGDLSACTEPLEDMLAAGFVPVCHGDVIAHAGVGATILSGDEIVCSYASTLDAFRVGLCSAVPGVLDGNELIPLIESLDDVAHVLGGSDSTDVTGGMAGKVASLLELETDAFVFGVDGVGRFLSGDSAGTKITHDPNL